MFKPLRLCCEILDYPTLLDYVFQLQTFMVRPKFANMFHPCYRCTVIS